MPLNLTDEVSLKLTVNDVNQIISAINGYYTGLISKMVEQANEQGKDNAPPRRPNGPQIVAQDTAC